MLAGGGVALVVVEGVALVGDLGRPVGPVDRPDARPGPRPPAAARDPDGTSSGGQTTAHDPVQLVAPGASEVNSYSVRPPGPVNTVPRPDRDVDATVTADTEALATPGPVVVVDGALCPDEQAAATRATAPRATASTGARSRRLGRRRVGGRVGTGCGGGHHLRLPGPGPDRSPHRRRPRRPTLAPCPAQRHSGFDHVTFAVEDLEGAVDFFGLLGFERTRAVVVSGDEMARYMGIPDWEADHVTLELTGAATHQEVQLLRFHRPPPRPDPDEVDLARIGYNHICFAVDDLDASLERLRAAGVRVRSDVLAFHDRRLVFVVGPGDVTVELAEWQDAGGS